MKIIIWEDLNLQTDVLTGISEDLNEGLDIDLDMDSGMEGLDLSGLNSEEIITTPLGTYLVRDYFNPMGQYSWAMAHTNFNITYKVLDDLVKTKGIEKILPLSRYRMLIAFGKVFSKKDVKARIYDILDANPPINQEAMQKISDLKQIYKRWCLYYTYDDNYDYATEEDFEEKEKLFRDQQKQFGGLVITHETEL